MSVWKIHPHHHTHLYPMEIVQSARTTLPLSREGGVLRVVSYSGDLLNHPHNCHQRMLQRTRRKRRHMKSLCRWAICCTWPTTPAIPGRMRHAACYFITSLKKVKPADTLAIGIVAPLLLPMIAGT